MIEIETKVRNWGNSLGITLPNEAIRDLEIKPGEKLKVLLLKDRNILKETFGALKFRKSTQKMMKETDKELYND